MSETRPSYRSAQSDPHCGTMEAHKRAEYVRVLDPQTGRFLFEFDPRRDLIIWRERGKRVEVELAQYR